MASRTQRTWVWVGSGSWWWTGKPGVLQSMGLQRVRHDWATELNWSEAQLTLTKEMKVSQLCPTLFNPIDCSTPGFPVLHHLPELAQTHVYWVSDAIQPSHPLLSPSSPALNLSRHRGLFKWVSSSHQWPKYWISASTSTLPMNTQDWSPLGWTGKISIHPAVQGTLKSLLQHHSSTASVLLCSAFL